MSACPAILSLTYCTRLKRNEVDVFSEIKLSSVKNILVNSKNIVICDKCH